MGYFPNKLSAQENSDAKIAQYLLRSYRPTLLLSIQ
jgi:hypothetical protein